jgi:glycosyltransferase involved in cell wall biosynthesis
MEAAAGPLARQSVSARPRVVIVITLAGVGGAQSYVASLLEALTERYEVVVAAHGRGPLSEAVEGAGARYEELRWMRRSLGPWDLAGVLELVALFRRERPEVAHLNSSKAGILGRLAAAICGVPVRIFTVHGWAFAAHRGLKSSLYRLADRILRPVTTAFVCPAHHEREAGIRARTCDPATSVVIPNAVDLRRFPAAKLGGDPPVLVSVGRLHRPKDFLTLVRALALLARGSFRAVIVGDGPDRPLIESAIAEAGLNGAIELTGEREDVDELLAAADLFALSSWSECFPISVLEAMAAGLPVAATAVGGVSEQVVEGETGLLVPAGDTPALARALETMLADPALRRRMGTAGRRRVEQRFDLAAFRSAHLELYERQLASRRRSSESS